MFTAKERQDFAVFTSREAARNVLGYVLKQGSKLQYSIEATTFQGGGFCITSTLTEGKVTTIITRGYLEALMGSLKGHGNPWASLPEYDYQEVVKEFNRGLET